MTPGAAQADECFRQRERLPFAKEPVERAALKVRFIGVQAVGSASGGYLFAPEGRPFGGCPSVYPYREEEIDHD